MTTRVLAGKNVNPLGFGAMNIAHGYSDFPTDREAGRLLHDVLDAGVDHLDTATLYGGHRSENLIGQHLKQRRSEYLLASKGGLALVDGRGQIDGRPETLRAQVDASLQRLQTEHIDLYYLHRLDPKVPIQESVGALAEAVAQGKIGGIGLSEVSVATLRIAHEVHPIAAVQNEYSLATRNPELGMVEACAELGTALVAFSPLYRGFLSGNLRGIDALADGDMRHHMPRFSEENYPHNLELVDRLARLATRLGTTAAALSLAWVLAQGEHVHAIPGTKNPGHFAENLGALRLSLSPAELAEAGEIINQSTIAGARYNVHQQKTIDSEEFQEAR
ncbi:aldo/keto reductase [Paeniglutamicibacter sulfureus]|uniref:Aryl-alcohol dehydrogenase-like predicted oxidoreductase n=1 Tax=Paeniglutamicibacter sulfureus TaxID=43666 RepID=A0ABU2BGG5_9MICC|nr:aldo/keto reductase [Paeniglutamicibacter sulfureus]MDR7357708.1 aryl-alcohol dehydrogenase-like predicted oxidoreductase [Paeniglutamicibacter sulfureus]